MRCREFTAPSSRVPVRGPLIAECWAIDVLYQNRSKRELCTWMRNPSKNATVVGKVKVGRIDVLGRRNGCGCMGRLCRRVRPRGSKAVTSIKLSRIATVGYEWQEQAVNGQAGRSKVVGEVAAVRQRVAGVEMGAAESSSQQTAWR